MKAKKEKRSKYNPHGFHYKFMIGLLALTVIVITTGEYVSGERVVISGMTLSFFLTILTMAVHQMYPLGYLGEVKTLPAIIALVIPFVFIISEFILLYFVSANVGSVVNFVDVIKVLWAYTAYAIVAGVYFERNEVLVRPLEIVEEG